MRTRPSQQNAPRPKEIPGIDKNLIRGIYEKCTRKYPPRKPGWQPESGHFGVDVTLESNEITELEKLIQLAQDRLKEFTQGDRRYTELTDLLTQMRAKLGNFGEEQRIVGDTSAQKVSKILLSGNRPGIKAPQDTFHLYQWARIIESVEKDLREYQSGHLYGKTARIFGKNVRKVYSFVKNTLSA